eukprot:5820350-Prymnesium_polylepis.1
MLVAVTVAVLGCCARRRRRTRILSGSGGSRRPTRPRTPSAACCPESSTREGAHVRVRVRVRVTIRRVFLLHPRGRRPRRAQQLDRRRHVAHAPQPVEHAPAGRGEVEGVQARVGDAAVLVE